MMTEQPDPKPNKEPFVWAEVISDMVRRDHDGSQKYGVHLQPFNGRDALQDAYEESLDKTVYLKQALMERKAIIRILEGCLNGIDAEDIHCPALPRDSSAAALVEMALNRLKAKVK